MCIGNDRQPFQTFPPLSALFFPLECQCLFVASGFSSIAQLMSCNVLCAIRLELQPCGVFSSSPRGISLLCLRSRHPMACSIPAFCFVVSMISASLSGSASSGTVRFCLPFFCERSFYPSLTTAFILILFLIFIYAYC